jgi:peptidoglycan/LPS O-acetylase OafA/YrhL
MMRLDRGTRLAELDALRGVAVLMVLVYHFTTRLTELFPQAGWGGFHFGGYGVHLFFVISGFVIIMTLDRSERAADFLVARFSRLYPAYWTAILLTAGFLWLANGPVEPPTARQVVVNFTMLQSFFKVPPVDGVYWTLEVELLFYAMALAVFCAGLMRRPQVPIAAWLVLSALFYSPLWPAYIESQRFAGAAARLLILEFAPFFALGVVFYRLYRRQGAAVWNYALAAAAYGLILAKWPANVSLMIGAAAFVLWKVGHGGLAFLRFPPLVFVGTISYSLYLVHQNIGHAIMVALGREGWGPGVRIAVATVVCVAFAAGITFFIEQPALRHIRRRYKARRARRVGTQAAAA